MKSGLLRCVVGCWLVGAAALGGCRVGHALQHRRVRTTTTRYLRAAEVVGGTELDTGRYEVAQYVYQSDVRHFSDRWYTEEIFLRARQLDALPIGQELPVPNPLFTVQGYGRATWYFEQFQNIGGTVTRLPAPRGSLRLQLALHCSGGQQQPKPLLHRTLRFQLDSTYFQRTRHDYHGDYDDLRQALKEPLKVRKLDLATWAIDYEKRNGPASGPDPLYQRLGELRNLEELDLKYSNLRELPGGFEKLTRLKVLDLSYNNLAVVPSALGQLDSLRELNLAWNRLDSIPPAFAHLQSLRSLNLGDNRLVRYPEVVSELSGLDSLFMSNANLHQLPGSIGRLRQLKTLELNSFWNSKRRNQLTNLDGLLLLPQLRRLRLEGNALERVPAPVYQLPNLEELDLLYNGLNPAAVDRKRLPRLKKLRL